MSDDFTDAEELQWFRELAETLAAFDRIFAKMKTKNAEMDSYHLQTESISKELTDDQRPGKSNRPSPQE